MLCVANRLFVADGHEDEFESRFLDQADRVETQPGFVKLEFLEPTDAPCYVIQSYWESDETFADWVGSEAFRKAHAEPFPDDMFTQDNELERYTVATTVTGRTDEGGP